MKVAHYLSLIDGSNIRIGDYKDIDPRAIGNARCNVDRVNINSELIWQMHVDNPEREIMRGDTMVGSLFGETGSLYIISFSGRVYRVDWNSGRAQWVGESRNGAPPTFARDYVERNW